MNQHSDAAFIPITVLMAVRNGEAYLAQAVESILNQEHRAFVFLIIDDASTDASATLLSAYASVDDRIRIVTNQRNLGLAASLNKGIRQTTTPYIARMDADDISLPGRLGAQLAFMEQHPEIAVVGCAIQVIGPNGHLREVWVPESTPEGIERALRQSGTGIPHPTAFMRTEAVKRSGSYRENFTTAQDLDLWLRTVEYFRIACLPEPMLYYRKHEASTTARKCTLQACSHVLAMLAAEYRRKGKPDPVEEKELCPELLMTLLQPGEPSALLWLSLLSERDICDKEMYVPEAIKTAYNMVMLPEQFNNQVLVWQQLRTIMPFVIEHILATCAPSKENTPLWMINACNINNAALLLTELATARRELSTARTELAVTRTQLAAAQAELAGVTASLSWKLTSPFRALKKYYHPK